MYNLVLLSARKQGGKDSCFDWYHSINPNSVSFRFADQIKSMCVKMFGIPHNQIYGTDEEKNMPTHLNWEDFPVACYEITDGSIFVAKYGFIEALDANHKVLNQKDNKYDVSSFPRLKKGKMNGRQVMSYFGTDCVRRFYGDAFARSTMSDIDDFVQSYEKQGKEVPVIFLLDTRFRNEVKIGKEKGGKVLRFARDLYHDTHESECDLDQDKFNHNEFDGVVYNQSLSIEEKNKQTEYFFKKWGII